MVTETAPKIALPTAKTKINKRWQDQKFLMIGAGKTGKSEFWGQGERTLFLECEPGLNHLEVMKVTCRSWADIRDVYVELYHAHQASLKPGAEPFPYDTIVIDTGDRMVRFAADEVIARAKEKYKKEIADAINTLGDVPNGNGWYLSTELVGNFLTKMEAFPAAIVVIAHIDKKEVVLPTSKYTRETISIGGQTGTNLLYWADHVMHVRSRQIGDEIQRNVRTMPTDTIEAGSRGKMIPDGMVWGVEPAANYKALKQLFD